MDIDINGTKKTVEEWASDVGISPATIRRRLQRGYTPTAAVKQEKYVREPRLRAAPKKKRATSAVTPKPAKVEADYTGRAVVFAECSERLRELPHGDIAAVLQALCLCFNAK